MIGPNYLRNLWTQKRRVPDGPLGLLVRTVQIVQSDYFDRTV